MTPNEIKAVMIVIGNAYPTSKFAAFDKEMFKVWSECLADVDYTAGRAAVVAGIMTSKFPPSIAEIRERVAAVVVSDVATPLEAWGLIQKAVRLYGWNKPKEAEAFLGPFIWSVVERITWRWFLDMDDREESTCFAQFRAEYNLTVARAKERAQIPEAVRELLGTVGGTKPGRIEGVST